MKLAVINLLLIVNCSILTISCSNDPEPEPEESILSLVDKDSDLYITASYIREGDLITEALDRNSDSWTFFAPTNDAWVEFYDHYGQTLPNRDFILSLIMHHSIPQKEMRTVNFSGPLTSLWTRDVNDKITIDAQGNSLSPAYESNNAVISMGNIKASNGILHVIDKVLVPSYITNMKGTNAELICMDYEMEFFYSGFYRSEAHKLGQNSNSYLELLASNKQHTIFASKDDIFRKKGVNDSYYSNEEWDKVLGERIIEGNLELTTISDGEKISSINGTQLTFYIDPGTKTGTFIDWNGDYDPTNPNLSLLDAQILDTPALTSSNGSIYLLDTI